MSSCISTCVQSAINSRQSGVTSSAIRNRLQSGTELGTTNLECQRGPPGFQDVRTLTRCCRLEIECLHGVNTQFRAYKSFYCSPGWSYNREPSRLVLIGGSGDVAKADAV